jgi:hypothetical protein
VLHGNTLQHRLVMWWAADDSTDVASPITRHMCGQASTVGQSPRCSSVPANDGSTARHGGGGLTTVVAGPVPQHMRGQTVADGSLSDRCHAQTFAECAGKADNSSCQSRSPSKFADKPYPMARSPLNLRLVRRLTILVASPAPQDMCRQALANGNIPARSDAQNPAESTGEADNSRCQARPPANTQTSYIRWRLSAMPRGL